jgi:hypothetical protein
MKANGNYNTPNSRSPGFSKMITRDYPRGKGQHCPTASKRLALALFLCHHGLMIEQDKTNKARILGYAIGLVAVIVVVAWKFATR